jgi:hypothetical protein
MMFSAERNHHQRGESSMPQGSLPFPYEVEKSESGFTPLAGLFLYLDLMDRMGFRKSLDRHVRARGERSQGFCDYEVVSSLVLLDLAGGDCVDGLRVLEGDEGFRRVMDRVRYHGLSRPARRALERRFRKERDRSVPSSSSVFRFPSKFHDARQEAYRPEKGGSSLFRMGE